MCVCVCMCEVSRGLNERVWSRLVRVSSSSHHTISSCTHTSPHTKPSEPGGDTPARSRPTNGRRGQSWRRPPPCVAPTRCAPAFFLGGGRLVVCQCKCKCRGWDWPVGVYIYTLHTHIYIHIYNISPSDLPTAGFTALRPVRDGRKSAEEQPGGGQVDEEGEEAVELCQVSCMRVDGGAFVFYYLFFGGVCVGVWVVCVSIPTYTHMSTIPPPTHTYITEKLKTHHNFGHGAPRVLVGDVVVVVDGDPHGDAQEER